MKRTKAKMNGRKAKIISTKAKIFILITGTIKLIFIIISLIIFTIKPIIYETDYYERVKLIEKFVTSYVFLLSLHAELKRLLTMKKILFFTFLSLMITGGLKAQEIFESLQIIESSVKDAEYYNFTISGDGHLSYNWGNNIDNNTTITIDLANVTISKDYTSFSPKLWINCIDNNSCIKEQGTIGSMQGMYFDYSRTYLPAKSQEDLEAMFIQMSYLMQYSTGR